MDGVHLFALIVFILLGIFGYLPLLLAIFLATLKHLLELYYELKTTINKTKKRDK